MARTAKGTGTDNRQKILDTAMVMIGEQGVEKTSLAAIAKAAGLSKGTVYYYYASKNDLVFDIADQHMERITTPLFDMIGTSGGITWERMLTAFFTTILSSESRSRLHLYLVREAVSGNPDLKSRFQATYAHWFGMVDQAYRQMPDSKPRPGAISKFLVALVDGFILQTLLETDETDIQDIVRLALKILDLP